MRIHDTLVYVHPGGTVPSFLRVVAVSGKFVRVAERIVICIPQGACPGSTSGACVDLLSSVLASWSVWDGSLVKPSDYWCEGIRVEG